MRPGTAPLKQIDDLVDITAQENGDAIADAARQLLELVLNQSPDAQGEGILVDLVVAGSRCVVSISPVSTPPVPDDRAYAATPLSPREHEIARMVADGLTNKEIATILDISSWTVSTHVRRIFGKLDVSTRAAMVARLMPNGLLDGDSVPLDHRPAQI